VTFAVHVAVPAGEAELAADALWQAGAAAIEERPGVLIAGTGLGGDPVALLAAVAGRWPAEVVAVDLALALDAWRVHARAVPVGDRLVVRPPWVEPIPVGPPAGQRRAGDRLDVVIDPGRAFGHGGHPSTRLVLTALDSLVGGGERVLDIGCGSGVLAIAALALGAGTAAGVDVDPAAVAATRDNAVRNRVADRLAVVAHVDDLDEARGVYDLVLANMLRPELVAMAPVVAGALAPGGAVVVSGVLVGQRGDVLAAYRTVGLAPVAEHAEDGWLAVILRAG
jgi:ribosomal protein L11 methyltransferase